jgi:hypothetical protein
LKNQEEYTEIAMMGRRKNAMAPSPPFCTALRRITWGTQRSCGAQDYPHHFFLERNREQLL